MRLSAPSQRDPGEGDAGGKVLLDAIDELCEWAGEEFQLHKCAKDGVSIKQHLIRAWQNTGRKPPELDAHGEMPTKLAYLWGWFMEVKKPVAYSELEAWARMTNRTLERWEIRALMRLDAALHEALS